MHEVLARAPKIHARATLTQTGVVGDPFPTLSVYTHSGDFDSLCKHWLNSAKCPTLPVVEYCPGGGRALGVLVESWVSADAVFAGASPPKGGNPYSSRTIRYASSR